jgi:four helix bundle protein
MAGVKRFEDLKAWQKARELVRAIYAASGSGKFARDFALRDQIRKAGISVMSNIAEGFERSGSKEFLQFLSVAKGSVGEVRSQLYVVLDQGYLTDDAEQEILGLTREAAALIGGLMRYLKSSELRGDKYTQ